MIRNICDAIIWLKANHVMIRDMSAGIDSPNIRIQNNATNAQHLIRAFRAYRDNPDFYTQSELFEWVRLFADYQYDERGIEIHGYEDNRGWGDADGIHYSDKISDYGAPITPESEHEWDMQD